MYCIGGRCEVRSMEQAEERIVINIIGILPHAMSRIFLKWYLVLPPVLNRMSLVG
jgi:hypothetical protein